uniref:Uncharacterized protein n=1 Tax=Lactuca sativa TaxID=4236 RepID=A0A9R1XBZ3_LACSA|nr:hypothetical protein LSAT_V11C500280450 [Lactuca sativa]
MGFDNYDSEALLEPDIIMYVDGAPTPPRSPPSTSSSNFSMFQLLSRDKIGDPKSFENIRAYGMNEQLKEMFQEQALHGRFKVLKSHIRCKLQEGGSLSTNVLMMKGYFDRLERLGFRFPQRLFVYVVLDSVSSSNH